MAATTTLIVNPEARGGFLRRKWPRLEPMLRNALGPIEICFTQKTGDGKPLAQAAMQKGARLIIAMGGDGTASEVASGMLAHQDTTHETEPTCGFGVLPCGTGGDLGRTLGTSIDLEKAAQAIVASPGRLIDAGRLDYTGNDGRSQRGYFINVASAGIGGLVDMYANQGTKLFGGKAAYFWASFRASLKYKNAQVRVRLDDRPAREHRIYFLAVANGRYFGGGMHVAPTGSIDDGFFEVVICGDMSFVEALQLGRHIYKGEHLSMPKISCTRARVVTLEPVNPGDHVLLDVDGETPGRLPATWTVMPRSLLLRS